METIEKPIREIIEAVISHVDPGMQKRVFSADGFVQENGQHDYKRHNVTLDNPKTLGFPEYRIFYANGSVEPQSIALLLLIDEKTTIIPGLGVGKNPEVTGGYKKLREVIDGLGKC